MPRPASLIVAALALVLVACGGDDAPDAPVGALSTISVPSAPGPVEPASSAAVGSLPVGEPLPLAQAGASAEAAPVGPSQVPCEGTEHLDHHWHASLTVVLDGEVRPIPADIGIRVDASPPCLYWVHTHVDRGVIHIEAPTPRDFTLGDFFAVWGAPLGPTTLLDREGEVFVYVDGEEVADDPAAIVLADQQAIVLSDAALDPDQLPAPDFSEIS